MIKLRQLLILTISAGLLLSCASVTKIQSKGGQHYIRDQRDGRRYAVAKLNGNWWMVDNFAMALPEAVPYKENKASVSRLGLTYPYKTIVKAAPKGWRLPTAQELAELFLAYGKVSYSGELPLYRQLFGPYEPELTYTTYQALMDDKVLNLPKDPSDLPDWNRNDKGEFRTLFWSSDEVNDRAYAVYWSEERGVHFSSYPQAFYGFCRFVKADPISRKERKLIRKNSKKRLLQEGDDYWNKLQFN